MGEMQNTGEANRLAVELGQVNPGMQDARDFALYQKQRDEERAMQDGLGKMSAPGGNLPGKKFKVIRRKVTKTKPDGSQIITFEFIVNREKVEDIIMKKKEK